MRNRFTPQADVEVGALAGGDGAFVVPTDEGSDYGAVDDAAWSAQAEVADGAGEDAVVEDSSHVHAFNICRCGNINIFFDTELRGETGVGGGRFDGRQMRTELQAGFQASLLMDDAAKEAERVNALQRRSAKARTVLEATSDARAIIAKLQAEVDLTAEATQLLAELNGLVGDSIEQGLAAEKRRLDLSLKKKRQQSRELRKSIESTKQLQNKVKLGQTLLVTGAIVSAILVAILVAAAIVVVVFARDDPAGSRCTIARNLAALFKLKSIDVSDSKGVSCFESVPDGR